MCSHIRHSASLISSMNHSLPVSCIYIKQPHFAPQSKRCHTEATDAYQAILLEVNSRYVLTVSGTLGNVRRETVFLCPCFIPFDTTAGHNLYINNLWSLSRCYYTCEKDTEGMQHRVHVAPKLKCCLPFLAPKEAF